MNFTWFLEKSDALLKSIETVVVSTIAARVTESSMEEFANWTAEID